MGAFVNLVGRRFGRLVVQASAGHRVYNGGRSFLQWTCLCDCGNTATIIGMSLKSGASQSCGCLHLEAIRTVRGPAIDLVGRQFNSLTVLRYAGHSTTRKRNQSQWDCQCVCGARTIVTGGDLTKGSTKGCGCLRAVAGVERRLDLTGHRYGKLTVIKSAGTRSLSGSDYTQWECLCDCGKMCIVRTSEMRKGGTRSCGCLVYESAAKRRKHGQSHGPNGRTAEYHIWGSMRSRCQRPQDKDFKHYGGRGICVCERWDQSFVAFFEDMGVRPSKTHSLDRINNDGNYEPGNCRWATRVEQANNKRSNRFVLFHGERMTKAEAARRAQQNVLQSSHMEPT